MRISHVRVAWVPHSHGAPVALSKDEVIAIGGRVLDEGPYSTPKGHSVCAQLNRDTSDQAGRHIVINAE